MMKKGQSQSHSKDCKYCGRKHQFGTQHCPAYGKECSKCHGVNHFASVCLSKKKYTQAAYKPKHDYEDLPGKKGKPTEKRGGSRKGHRGKQKLHAMEHYAQESANSTDDEDDYLLSMNDKQDFPKKLFAKLKLGMPGVSIRFQIDSGSTVNVLLLDQYKRIFKDDDLQFLEKTNPLSMFNKTEIRPEGKRHVMVMNPKNSRRYRIEIIVVPEGIPILGAQSALGMKLIKINKDNIMQMSTQNGEIPEEVQEILDKYKDVFEGEGHLEHKLHLEVDPAVKPVKLPVRKLPLSVRDKLKSELDRLEKLKIIAPVDKPTDWVSSMVAVTKPNGMIRLCLDLKPLNKALKRNHTYLPMIDDILPDLKDANVFSVADARNGYWHVELDEESSYLTTFSTFYGRRRWLRMPFGISPASEEFHNRLKEALDGLPGIAAIHDDILIYGKDETDHDRHLEALLQRCREKGIKLNRDKLKVRLNAVPFMGHILTDQGLKMDPSKLEAIRKMPAPQDKQGVRRLLGMINYLQKFAPIAELTLPLRDLIKNETEFTWCEDIHGKALEKIKDALSTPPVLAYFDPAKPTTIQCDVSMSGLGASLMQQGQPIAYASRSITETETNYAQIEKELLAIVYAVERFHTYVYGRRITVESDHKPLESILKKNLTSAPKRLQRMMLRLQHYDFEVVYKKGTEMHLADTLSRAYLETTNGDEAFEAVHQIDYVPMSIERQETIRNATSEDPAMKTLANSIRNGWPETKDTVPYAVRDYYNFRDEMSVQDGYIFKGHRLVVPEKCRPEIIKRIHSSHIGLQGCLRRARECVYWPRLFNDLKALADRCETCSTFQAKQPKETMVPHQTPTRPWELVACDLFHCDDQDYLVLTDYYSDFIEVDRLQNKKAPEVIGKLKAHYARHGLPTEVMTDNGPPYDSQKFKDFAKQYDFKHVTSSPHYPQSNGKSESAVKVAKKILKKAHRSGEDPYLALLAQRNTPTENVGLSPVQRLFGRRNRTTLPVHKHLLKPQAPNDKDVQHRLGTRQDKKAKYYNPHTKDLPPLKQGDVVRIQPTDKGRTKWEKAIVKEKIATRSYNVEKGLRCPGQGRKV
ncbi:uncharacterized protein K02A2.6-like [Lineus longissimus]|uniref:uncharacterized protein K02A2.6-like n=1 Tax=Lineus longissimus TaxID=88925 RepID=UPI00315C7A8D